jgi:hypothetical protein
MTIKQLKLGRSREHRRKWQRPPRDPRPVKAERPVRYHSLSLPSLYTRDIR